MKRTFDPWLNAICASAEEREERALATLERIEARRLTGTRIERADWHDGRIYISSVQYFDDVPQETWEHMVDGYQVARAWLIDRKHQALSFDDVLQYLHILRTVPKGSHFDRSKV